MNKFCALCFCVGLSALAMQSNSSPTRSTQCNTASCCFPWLRVDASYASKIDAMPATLTPTQMLPAQFERISVRTMARHYDAMVKHTEIRREHEQWERESRQRRRDAQSFSRRIAALQTRDTTITPIMPINTLACMPPRSTTKQAIAK